MSYARTNDKEAYLREWMHDYEGVLKGFDIV